MSSTALNLNLRTLGLATLVAFLAVASSPAASAQSAKATVRVGNIHLVEAQQQLGWTTMMRSSLKTANKMDLSASVSLEAGLLTRTTVKSKGGKQDTSTADSFIKVRVLVDGEQCAPGEVVFARRNQELTAKLSGIIAGCMTVDELTGSVIIDEECVEPEEIGLLLETMSANSFNFIYADCTPGEHRIEVQCYVGSTTSSEAGTADAVATVGKGSVTVQELRLVNGEKIDL